MPIIAFPVHPLIDIEGVQKLTAQLDELSLLRAQDQLAITELREELFKLRFINNACRTKLKRYPQLLQKQKQVMCLLYGRRSQMKAHVGLPINVSKPLRSCKAYSKA